MENIYYVYSHIRLKDGKCFYIGMGKGDRVLDGRSGRNANWRDIVYADGGFTFKILFNNISKKKAIELEKFLIKKIGEENLTNCNNNEYGGRFVKNEKPWNYGKKFPHLSGENSAAAKKVEYNGKIYNSVGLFCKEIGIGSTTFYKWVKKNKIRYV